MKTRSDRAAWLVRTFVPAVLAVAAGGSTAWGDVEPAAAMLRYPGISAKQIVFVYANDIWVAPRTGGMAAPLASPPGSEAFPRFSPDGKTIAFVGNYEGNRDLYTIGVGGGVASRVTHHPAGEVLCDWTPDGSRLVFLTNGFAGLARQSQLFTVSAAGGLPEKMPMPYAGFGSISRDGEWVAFTPHSTDTRTWKRYRGGMATDIWLMNLKTKESKKITEWEGTDTLPMWGYGPAANTVFYVSDGGPEHRLNIWSYDRGSGVRAQVTNFAEDDVKWPSIGPGPGPGAAGGEAAWGEVIFQLGSSLRVLDLSTKQTREVKITIPGDRPKLMSKDEDAAEKMSGSAISPSGKRVLAVGRGDVFSLPVKEGVVRNLTRTDNVFERDPAWSPDGKWVAVFSDESGEYELWLRPADAKAPEEEKKEEGEEKKGEEKKDEKDAAPAAGATPVVKLGPVKLTNMGPGFRFNPTWAPDSKHIVFTDKAGRLMLASLTFEGAGATAELKELDQNPMGDPIGLAGGSWSHDSNWIAYCRADEASTQTGVWLYNLKEGKKTQVVSAMFNCSGVTFDRKGDWLYFNSGRTFNPVYSDIDTTFAYTGGETLLMVSLREDVKNPYAPKSDEEEVKKEEKAKTDKEKDKDKKDAKPAEKEGEKKDGEKKEGKAEAAKADDGVSGTWEGKATGPGVPPDGLPITIRLKIAADGSVTGSMSSAMGSSGISGSYDKATGALTFTGQVHGEAVTLSGTVKNGEVSGTWQAGKDGGAWTGKRTSADAGGGDEKEGAGGKDGKEKPKKDVKIDLEGFERRAIALPVAPGNFGDMGVSDDGKLVYVRATSRGVPGEVSIKIFDPKDEAKEEKTVTAGGSFQLSADGKKLLVRRGSAMVVVDASAGGGKAQSVSTSGMRVRVRPREEWKQIFTDVYRLERDLFYEPTMHHVDWAKMRDHYGKMIEDCVSREDVAYVIAEFISELNIGHAYVTNPGDVETGPAAVSVGMLGCDFVLENGAYKISTIYEGGVWDDDARGPLSQPGEKKNRVSVGDYLLAVNGVPVDMAKDPWAALRGLADKVTAITVSSKPVLDDSAREVLVKPAAGEGNLRYRAWIEKNRKYVAEKSGGKIGYIYVPNTGVDGQTDLFRQFFGQREMGALIIDERWNGGGQIPNRFIELLNRPVTNYWARRDGRDWTWPPDSAPGPKAMLINGLAGSGGDMFPWLFKHHKIGKVIGTRTWGGLVGISGTPVLIDGGAVSVPNFGFYKKDGTWGVEGHGVDPDMEVIDDPAKMVEGGDPQLDAAIAHLLEEIKTNGYQAPKRPESPDRSGMGIPVKDR